MPVPGFLASFADKAQTAINSSSLSQHIPGSLTGRASSPGEGGTGSSKSHTLEQFQHQFRTFQQTYGSTSPVQKIITTEKGVALAFDNVNRDVQAQSKELYTWGQNEDPDIKDVTDRLAFLNYISGSLANTLAQKLNAARTPFKALRDNEVALTARRNARAGLQTQIARLEHGQERGYEKRIVELREQLRKAEHDDEPLEKEHEILKRKAIRESEQLKFEAMREYGEKLALISQASVPILEALPPIPPSTAQPYSGAEKTGGVRANLQRTLDNWIPGQSTLLAAPAGANLDRSNTRSFGETHAQELSKINSDQPHQSQTGLPTTPPLSTSHPSASALSPINEKISMPVATTVPAPAPIPVSTMGGTSPVAPARSSSVLAKSPLSPQNASPPINPSFLNNTPATIPAPSSPAAAVAPNPVEPEMKVPSVTPTVAETGTPVVAAHGDPGPATGSLRDIRSSSVSGAAAPPPPGHDGFPPPPPAAHSGAFESAEEEKKRLQREERDRLLQGSGSSAGAGASASTPKYESAEEEKKRLERERLLHGGPPPPGSQGKPEDSDDIPPPAYQDF
ncbi:Eisosome component PIL1-domain-containing protein [Amylostereum chailletii]|nr:Eisosome component PIL1-domain-containing protein [Amylostereum chailletii]